MKLPEQPEWFAQAACARVGGDWWFPEEPEELRQAKRICRGCEVRLQCLRFAVENGGQRGVWGGLASHRQRRKVVLSA